MAAAATMTDDEEILRWVELSRRGDREAFGRLSERLRPWLESVAAGITRDSEAARDLGQEALLRAYRSLGQYDDSRPFNSWIFAIVRNLSLNHLRKTSGERLLPEGESEGIARRSDSGESLRAALARVDEEDRRLLLLRYAEGLSGREMAARLSISEGNLRVRLHRALIRLRRELGDES